MPIILVDKQSFQTFYSECVALNDSINDTNSKLLIGEGGFVDRGYKKPNLKKMVADVKKLNKPISQVYFKNTGGNISISPSQVDQNLDSVVREIISELVQKDITATAVEPVKKKQLADKLKQSKTFGIPTTVLQKALNMRSADFIQSMEAMAVVQGNSIQITNAQGFGDIESAPSDGEIDGLVEGVFGEIFGQQDNSWLVLGSDFIMGASLSLAGSSQMLLWVVSPQAAATATAEANGLLRYFMYIGFMLDGAGGSGSLEELGGIPVLKIPKNRVQNAPEQITLTNYVSNLIPGGTQLNIPDASVEVSSYLTYSGSVNFPNGVIGNRYTLSRLTTSESYYVYGIANLSGSGPITESTIGALGVVPVEGVKPTSTAGITIKSVVSIGEQTLATVYYGYTGTIGTLLFR